MYIHIGGDVILPAIEIIAILPYAEGELAKDTAVFLHEWDTKHDCKKIASEDSVKSVIVTDTCIYFSPVSSQTLKRRSMSDGLELLNDELGEALLSDSE
ncbi:extracellular matrix regulator RemB [Shouchella clausii]|uniref:extracellular matrix regulator RemB n=1 Tax=Shouchella clausii TaxID=79880 RepID=UPI002148C252|nr:DUF370 domain-containing protein [Shouchella clausii]MCR1288104.1 DUF370 domain-containing protein [Shouchella clausii]